MSVDSFAASEASLAFETASSTPDATAAEHELVALAISIAFFAARRATCALTVASHAFVADLRALSGLHTRFMEAEAACSATAAFTATRVFATGGERRGSLVAGGGGLTLEDAEGASSTILETVLSSMTSVLAAGGAAGAD